MYITLLVERRPEVKLALTDDEKMEWAPANDNGTNGGGGTILQTMKCGG